MNGFDSLEALEAAAGIDHESDDERLRNELAEADDQLLEDLVQLRKDKGLTQAMVAARMGRDKAAVSNFERLSADPHLSTVRRYAAAIGARVSHQVTDSESDSASTVLSDIAAMSFDIVWNLASSHESSGTDDASTHDLLERFVNFAPPIVVEEGAQGARVINLDDQRRLRRLRRRHDRSAEQIECNG
ncbi:helix-turn-helix DNA binding domain protein [Gordonia phage JuJu]|uniref:Helix-turn-helix DNA binding domain protein n=1 Tax=Gordonia phage JuJu TaxID=2590929 RepID=A0A516KR40_9CAUD|nr:transcriptional regulator [Gordonia phage JuJu]QDP44161.1 helix-turn-helix DNA binding domain protein [Gordonia phage JuJu]